MTPAYSFGMPLDLFRTSQDATVAAASGVVSAKQVLSTAQALRETEDQDFVEIANMFSAWVEANMPGSLEDLMEVAVVHGFDGAVDRLASA